MTTASYDHHGVYAHFDLERLWRICVLSMEFGEDFIGCVCFRRTWIWIWSPESVSLLRFRSFPILFSLCQQVIWGLEDFRTFVCFPFSPALCNWFVHFVWNAVGQRGIVGTGFRPVAFVAFGLTLGHEAGGLWSPLVSPAPSSLACSHAEE